jgi:4-amino-4-deoxy-L-arabinose transferase-like glycosyltransferase
LRVKEKTVTALQVNGITAPGLNGRLRGGFQKLDWALLGILGLAFLVRLYAWWQAPRQGFVIDEAEYYQIASLLADGRGWGFYDTATWVRPPLYVMLLGGIFRFFGPNLEIVRLVQVCLSVATVYLLYRLAWRTFGRKTGLVTALLAAVAWPFAVLSYLLLSETLFIFLFLVALNFLVEYLGFLPGSLPEKPAKQNRLLRFLPPPNLWLVAGGFILGLSALTRGQVLSFVPFIVMWILLSRGWRNWRNWLPASAVLVAVFVITISPWALRNYQTYGRPFIDTTGGYNFYLGALHGRNGALVSQTLEAVKNHAERENLGYQKGLEVLFKNPANFVSKGIKETTDFWSLNFGADERLEGGYTRGFISPSWLIPDQLLGDTLYITVVALALLGLVTAPRSANGFKSFVVIWLLYNMALSFAFFAVTRLRLPVYYLLFPFAAYTLTHPREILAWLRQPFKLPGRPLKVKGLGWLAGLALPVIFLFIVLPGYLPADGFIIKDGGSLAQTKIGLDAWVVQQNTARGDELRKQGHYDEAIKAYSQGLDYAPATQIGLGLTEVMQGKYDDAIGRIGRASQDIAQSHLALGWIYLRQGNEDYAHSEFRSRQIALDVNSATWAWDNLPATPLPDNLLTLGEFDWGYVKGFHIYEKEDSKAGSPYFRWTNWRGEDGRQPASLRFPLAPGTRPASVSVRLNGYRPDSLTPPSVEVFANGRSLGKVQTTRTWQTFTLALPADLNPGREIIIDLLPSNTFVPGAFSRRELGVMVQWAKLS